MIEKRIFSETGLKIAYPNPRERIDIDDSVLESLKDCSLVSVTEESQRIIIEVKLPLDLERLEQDRKQALLEFEGEVQQILRSVNSKFSPLVERFEEHYSKRKARAFEYLLLATAQESDLVLPQLTHDPILEISHGKLPILSDRKEDYLPLDLSLEQNVQVLVGPNMTGKTTILKTLYFLLFLTRHGLPVPARKMRLKLPSELFLHLPNPGDLQKNLSALGDELEFWAREFPKNSLVLVDELFQSTDPVSGAQLSKIFLEEFRNSGIFLLVTSHYSQVLKVSGLRFLRMKNYGGPVPFQPETEPLSGIESEVLKSTLDFQLPDRVIDRIKKRIQRLQKTEK
jgi:dsDNA-specific endonuclease/ATPase MutS2